ncbi:hypothetical protein CCR75_004703 [Bremia lactucae]|uniref:Seipin n=1 Tax=Bremia lactucae TaxID=4779 RepID=A0A976NYW6_BRELC|nr:hypothetical protein CCR75_004703 [Bremia lactucae]
MLLSWVPWALMQALLPTSAIEVLQDDTERQHLRDELMQTIQVYSKVMLHWVLRTAQIFTAISFLFVTASLFYALLYYLVIPSRFHEQDVIFHYGRRHMKICEQGGHPLSLPHSSLDLQNPEHQWQTLLPKQMEKVRPVLVSGVKYDVIVELTVPESRINAEVGVFMVSTTLYSEQEKGLATSARPAALHDMPAPVRWLKLMFWLAPYTLGFSEPTQTLRVTAINGYPETTEYPLTRVDIELNTPELHVYSAKLIVIAQLTGLRYFMYHWSVPTALLFILNFVFVEALVLSILYAVYVLPQLDEEAATNTAVLEAAAVYASDKATEVLATESALDPDDKECKKSEASIDKISFKLIGIEEVSSGFEEAIDNIYEENTDVKLEPVVNCPQ